MAMAILHPTTEYRFGHLVKIDAPRSCFDGLVGEVDHVSGTGSIWIRLRLPDFRGNFGEDIIPFPPAEVVHV